MANFEKLYTLIMLGKFDEIAAWMQDEEERKTAERDCINFCESIIEQIYKNLDKGDECSQALALRYYEGLKLADGSP